MFLFQCFPRWTPKGLKPQNHESPWNESHPLWVESHCLENSNCSKEHISPGSVFVSVFKDSICIKLSELATLVMLLFPRPGLLEHIIRSRDRGVLDARKHFLCDNRIQMTHVKLNDFILCHYVSKQTNKTNTCHVCRWEPANYVHILSIFEEQKQIIAKMI